MKKSSHIIIKAFVFSLVLIVSQGCIKFGEEAELKRNGIYDKSRSVENMYSISLDSVEVVKEDMTENGLIEVDETVWYRVYIKNDGPEPAYVSQINIERETPLFILNNSSSSSNFTFSLKGEYVVENFLEPGESYALSIGETTDEGEDYSYNLRRSFQNVGDDPSMKVTITTGLKLESIIDNEFIIPIDYQ